MDEHQAAVEVDDLCQIIGSPQARPRVLDIGSGARTRADSLTRRGYEVIAFDLQASDAILPREPIDAAICLELDWHEVEDSMAVLRAVRDRITDHGVLAVGSPGTSLTTGSRAELGRLVREAGFEPAGVEARSNLIVATPAPVAPASLALSLHHAEEPPPATLNLRWSPDEVDWLDPGIDAIWAPLLESPAAQIAQLSRHYALADPWGGERAAATLSSFFGVELPAESIVFGAGATSLLRQVAPLVRYGRLLTSPLVHRDFPIWSLAEGARLDWFDEHHESRLIEAIRAGEPTMVYLDRPSTTGAISSLESIASVCREARRYGGVVAIDEAYLAYFAGAISAVSLVPATENLIVIRSLSKAYCCGGLRVGFAVAGKSAAASLRRVVAPLQVSELAYQLGLRLLAAGDIFVKLRERIVDAKRETSDALARYGLTPIAGDPRLPWIVVDDRTGSVETRLRARGVIGKRLLPFSPAAPTDARWLRLSIPLSATRMADLRRAMGAE